MSTATTLRQWQRERPAARLQRFALIFTVVAISVWCWQSISSVTTWSFVLDAPRQGADIASRMVPPAWGYLDKLWKAIWDTIAIATLGTLMAMMLATPLAFLAARTTTPNGLLRAIALLAIAATRSINSLIWALLFVSILGPGMLAGVLAIGMRSIGFIGKLLYEAIEEIDPAQVEAIRATGATGPQLLAWGIVPQVMPAYAGISIFRWDINIRESAVIGLVGAGGIGLLLDSSVNTLAWRQVSMILVVIMVLVVISEAVSAVVRRRFL